MPDPIDPRASPKGRPARTWPYALGVVAFAGGVTALSYAGGPGERVANLVMALLNLYYGVGCVLVMLGVLWGWLAKGGGPK